MGERESERRVACRKILLSREFCLYNAAHCSVCMWEFVYMYIVEEATGLSLQTGLPIFLYQSPISGACVRQQRMGGGF